MLKPHPHLVFEEYFKQKKLNENIWNIELGEKWFNDEKQCYVNNKKNLKLSSFGLRLIADLNPLANSCRYQSSRINTRGKMEWQYGTFIIRAKIPFGIGSWPAIWFLPSDIEKVKWPRCGEIDLMEHVGHNPETIHFSLHSLKQNHILGTQRTKFQKIPGVLEGFHDYQMIWRPEGISFFCDNVHIVTFEKHKKDNEETWPFDKPYFLILNIAVGGTWGGKIEEKDLKHQPYQ